MAGVYTVKQVNSYIKNMFKQDFLLNSVSVKGEISNCKYHTSGHIYFTLKDADAALSVIMFASQAAKLAFKLRMECQLLYQEELMCLMQRVNTSYMLILCSRKVLENCTRSLNS